jgi:hypothetical protein
MRLPVDNCCIATDWLLSVERKAACENNALTLVLITAMFFSCPIRVNQISNELSRYRANLFFDNLRGSERNIYPKWQVFQRQSGKEIAAKRQHIAVFKV